MWEDPIVAEVHRTREKLAAEHHFDIASFFADIRKRQTALGSRLVSQRKPEEKKAPQPGTSIVEESGDAERAIHR
jgi:hypothetical protein